MPLTEKNNYKVYIHKNRNNGKVYIGITRQEPERRWQKGHGYYGTYFGNAIIKHGWDSFDHEVIVTGLSREAACETEKALIKAYRSNEREFGYNICEGGQTGDNLAPKFGADNPKAVAVRAIDCKTGNIYPFSSVATAARILGINHRGICKACRGQAKTYMGLIWEYIDSDYQKPVKPTRGKYDHVKQRKRVLVQNMDGTCLRFNSINDAAEYYGIAHCNISRYLTGKRADQTGRRWSYCL